MIKNELATVPEKDLKVHDSKVNAALAFAEALVITNDDDYNKAMEEGKVIKTNMQMVEAMHEAFVKPLKDHVKKLELLFTPKEKGFTGALNVIRGKMTVYSLDKQKRIDAEKQKIADREGEGKGKLKPETAAKKIADLGEVANTTKTETATAKMVTTTVYLVEDKKLIPLEYMEANMTAIKAAFKAGNPVPGIKVDTQTRTDIA